MIALHTLFLREHNRLAAELRQLNPHWGPDTLYQDARKILGAVHQVRNAPEKLDLRPERLTDVLNPVCKVLTWDHYLPHILGRSAHLSLVSTYKGYDPTADPSISNVFSTAAFRFAHVTVHPLVNRFGAEYRWSPEHPALPLHHSLFASWRLVHEGGFSFRRTL